MPAGSQAVGDGRPPPRPGGATDRNNGGPEMTFHFYVCGNCNVADEHNPIVLLRDPLAQSIVRRLNDQPTTATQMAAAVGEEEGAIVQVLSALERTGAVAGGGEPYRLAFPMFTAGDQQAIWAIATGMGSDIAHRLADMRPALVETLDRLSSARHVALEQLLLAVVGCVALDWASLERLEELGYLVRHKPQPGGGDYILFGSELGDEVRERFCYSHSYRVAGYTFTTFGDLTGHRNAFPDLLWQLEETAREREPLGQNASLRTTLRLYLEDLLLDAARLLESLAGQPLAEEAQASGVRREKVGVLVPALVELGYLEDGSSGWRPTGPVFLASDRTSIETAAALVVKIVEGVVSDRYREVQRALQGTSPARNGVPFEEVFNEVWHFVLSEANRALAETGFMAPPVRRGPGSARFLAWLSCPESM